MLAIKRKRKWTAEEIQEIRARYQTSYVKDLAEKFGVEPRQLTAIASYYGIKKEEKVTFKIKRVKPERSKLNPFYLEASKKNIGLMIFREKDFEKAKKLEAIYKSMNEAINKSL